MAGPTTPASEREAIDHVLVTNDDGIASPGLDAVVDALSPFADVTVVAPVENLSGIGTQRSDSVSYERTDRGYAVDGTPADCVAFGARGLDRPVDAVVSGCNLGPNAGRYVLGRSGTVGAAIEAAWMGLPAVAVSAYDPESLFTRPADAFSYERAADAVEYLLPTAVDACTSETGPDLLNVNVPVERRAEMRLTEPADHYDTEIDRADGTVRFDDDYGPVNSLAGGAEGTTRADIDVPAYSEQGAIRDGVVGVSPLAVPLEPVDCRRTRSAVETYEPT
mgnify:CR=1 FL=1